MNRLVIAGGGLAGGAVACALAQAGRGVTLIEREAAPAHKICGEFLSTEAQAYLAKLGLDLAPLGGHEISHLRLIRGRSVVTTALPFRGLGLTRKTLDEALLRHAAGLGAEILRGQALRRSDSGWDVTGVGAIAPDIMFLATGKHEMRLLPRKTRAKRDLVGFKMYYRLAPDQLAALAHHIELIMFEGGYAGLQLVEDDQANLCFLVERRRLIQAGGQVDRLMATLQQASPHLAARLACACPHLPAPLTIANVPYGFIHHHAPTDAPNIYRLGDQAGVIQSFTGDGMSIALHSAALAAQSFLAGVPPAAFHRRLAGDISGQIGRANALYRLMTLKFAQPALFGLARAWPRGLGLAAQFTRVPPAVRV
jgi:flavin-dependent dehydrogenase